MECPASPPRARPRQRCAGFTLIELMLALVVMGIVAAVAYPRYTAYVNRAKVAAAIGDIGRLKLRIDGWRLANNDTLPASLAAVGMALIDPWGNPYQYLPFAGQKGNGGVRKDKNLVPINTDYDLYSMGADGASSPPITAKASRDDVIMANDGAYIGLASGY